jgi:hypothetical protein
MVKLQIKTQDNEIQWTDYFDSLEKAEQWIAEEQTRKYWEPTWTFEIIDITPAPIEPIYAEKRIAEYPTPHEFMDAWFDGGEEKLAELQTLRLSIKAKYPK